MTDATDLELLRRHEPILRFTRGELFLPMPVKGYIEACDLLQGPSIREASIIAPAGTLTLEKLGEVGDPPPGAPPVPPVRPEAHGRGRAQSLAEPS